MISTTKQLKEEDENAPKENAVEDIPPKNGPHTMFSYVRGWLQRSHLTDMIRGTLRGTIYDGSDQPVSPKDFVSVRRFTWI